MELNSLPDYLGQIMIPLFRRLTELKALVQVKLTLMLIIAVTCAACLSMHDPKIRRDRLLALYPPGQTLREDVQEKWAPNTPMFTAVRPAHGWSSLENPRVREHVAASELRTGNAVQRVDCYLGVDGLFGLCLCWFYYDEADKIVDAEWQYHTD